MTTAVEVSDSPDPIDSMEHDHTRLSQAVAEARNLLGHAHGVPERERHLRALVPVLVELLDDMFEHFAREEEGLFPFLQEHAPQYREAVERMLRSHDRICGAASRILSLIRRGRPTPEEWTLVDSLFARFDADYTEHARDESVLLRRLTTELNAADRQSLRGLLAQL